MSRPRRRRPAVVCAVVAIVVTACTDGSETNPPPVAVVTTVAEPPRLRVDDGVLRIGALVPAADTAVGAALDQSLEDAVGAVNDAGGVLGRDIQLVTLDEGATATTAAQAIEALVADDVDAIIGPTSSNSAIGALDEAIDAGIVACSPTASSIALDDFPDQELFFRTIATDSLQAIAIARLAEQTGATDIAVVHVDDAFGRPFAEATVDALEAEGSFVVSTVSVPVGDDDLSNELDDLGATQAQTAILLGSGTDIARLLEALGQRRGIVVTDILVNDAARDAASRPVIAQLPASLRLTISGVAPQIVLPDTGTVEEEGEDEGESNVPFATQVEDCVNLIALAAVQGASDSPRLISGQMSSVSSGGSPCRSFVQCVELIERGLQIDYDGRSGVTELGRDGEPVRARFDEFGFASDGSDVFERSFIIER